MPIAPLPLKRIPTPPPPFAGWMFSVIWRSIRPILDAGTQKKIALCNGAGKDELLEHIAPEHLPAEYGGTCACPGGCPNGGQGLQLLLEIAQKGARQVEAENGGFEGLRAKVQRAYWNAV